MQGRRLALVLSFLFVVAACARPNPRVADAAIAGSMCKATAVTGTPSRLDDWSSGARLLDDLGSFHRSATTRSVEAQRYFDQGMRLLWAFNHDEAARSFVRAGQLDPDCAACWWGASLALGPNYNTGLMADRARAAWDALERAKASSSKASPVERALIDALGRRSSGPEALDAAAMQPFLEAYATAMDQVSARFPDDNDVRVMDAEALMTAHAWKLWTNDGEPTVATPRIVALLEAALARDPQHPGANHYYIHTMEASRNPSAAIPSADRLAALAPGAGHLVHMPSHIYQRVGRYADSEAANRKGVEADLAYMRVQKPQGYYPGYLAHNYDFEAFAAIMRGRSAVAMAAQRNAVATDPDVDFYAAKPLLVAVRFGRWDAILAEPMLGEKLPVGRALQRFARSYAFAANGRVDDALTEARLLDEAIAAVPPGSTAGLNQASDVLAVASKVVAARIAHRQGRDDEEIALLQRALVIEDGMAYDEPEDWLLPTRHVLGAALLARGRAAEAEATYREDLRRRPENGWALCGLALALKAQQRDASSVEQRFANVWKDADTTLTASAL
jgi:tetratricopeptide (TPR) repeat protein